MGGVSPLFRIASHYFSEFFNFGLVEFKDVEKLRSTFQSYPKPSESDLPQAVTLIGQEPSDEEFASVRIFQNSRADVTLELIYNISYFFRAMLRFHSIL